MSLSNLDKTHLDELLLSLNTQNEYSNSLEAVKANHAEYAQLKLIAKQINGLRSQALEIINNSKTQQELHKIKTTLKLVSGNYYYLYEKKSNKQDEAYKYFSLISNEEWNKTKSKFNDIFLGKYLYDFDKQFIKITN